MKIIDGAVVAAKILAPRHSSPRCVYDDETDDRDRGRDSDRSDSSSAVAVI